MRTEKASDANNPLSSSSSSSSSSSYCSRFWSSALRAKPILPPTDTSVCTNSGDGLVRRLGLLELILIGVGASIGAGIFVVTGTVARDAGPGVTVSFILAGASCILNALCYAELATCFPAVVGGAYLYSYTAFNELTAFLVFAQMMLDYHIGAASIARSLASYVVTVLELIPFLDDNIPNWVGHGSKEILGSVSFNLLAPILLILLTLVLCRGVGESSFVNLLMTTTKVVIVIFVIIVGSFKVDVTNWSPFAPNGAKAVLTGATVVFFSYVGFDAVANSAEESKRPQRDLPIGIMGSLVICIALYVAVCLVLTGMVPYQLLGEDAPLAEAFNSRGLKWVSVLISFGAVAGLTTTLLVGLYVQSRLYLGLGRDGLLPSLFAKVHPERHTPIHSQIWVGIVAIILAGLFNVHVLSHILSVGSLDLCSGKMIGNAKAHGGLYYLNSNANSSKGILFQKNENRQVEVYTDADWAGCLDDRRSTSAYCTLVWGNLVTWRSKKHQVVARSSAEAEFRAMAQGICEVIWIRSILEELHIKLSTPMKLFCDNNSAISIAHNPVQHDRTKHVEIDRHFIKENLEKGEICMPYIPTTEQLADVLTKGLYRQKFENCLNKLGMKDIFAPT